MVCLTSRIYRFQKKFDRLKFDQKMCLKGICITVLMIRGISLGKVNT